MTEKQNAEMRISPAQITPAMSGEEWRKVAGHDGYFVSNLGRVCSMDRVIIRSNGATQFCSGRVLRPRPRSKMHLSVTLSKGRNEQVHTLVLEAFVGPRPHGLECLHWDDNPENNILSNLRWGTRSENVHDGIRNGKHRVGERMNNAKLTDDAVRFIRDNLDLGDTKLGIKFGVSSLAIKLVRTGMKWKHVR